MSDNRKKSDWKIVEFIRMGFTATEARQLTNKGTTLGEVDSLYKRGCPTDLIIRILEKI